MPAAPNQPARAVRAPVPDAELARRIAVAGAQAGLTAVGFTSASVLEPALTVLPLRKDRGFAAEMQFTYRNPQRSTNPIRTLPKARSIVAAALAYGPQPEPGPGEARVGRYAVGDNYERLQHCLEQVAEVITGAGYQARIHADDNNLVDRNVAWRAGIGAYGKNANLLVPGVGSWVVLGNIVTDALLPPATEARADVCGSCRRCIDACPTGAIVGPGVVDARKCIAWVVQGPEPIPLGLRAAVGDRIYGCDDCQTSCPESPDGPPSQVGAPIETLWVLGAGDDELMERVQHWYIANRDPNVVRRTALVVLGNTADGSDPDVAEVLVRYLASPVAQLADHAEWAATALGRADLL